MKFDPTMIPPRTHATSLSSSELLLFDMLFRFRCVETHLRGEAYRFHLNLSYSHDIDDEDLPKVLSSLQEKGDVVQELAGPRRSWGLSERGGEKWEQERMPDWNSYCSAWTRPTTRGRTIIGVASPSERTAECFWNTANNTGYWLASSKGKRRKLLKYRLLYWKSFSPTFVIVGCGREEEEGSPSHVDWASYETSRIWWRTAAELSTLRTK